MKTHRPSRERGIALLLVLIAVVLIAALATEVSQTAATQARVGRNAMNDLLLRTAVEGRAQILRAALRYDLSRADGIDTESDDWSWYNRETLSSWGERAGDATTVDPGEGAVAYSNTEVELQAWCEDERSKVNLLGLSRPQDSPEFKMTRELLVRLIDEFRDDTNLDVDEGEARDMVDDLVEWLADTSEEDENPMPPVASGRGRLQSVDDLLRVPGGRWTRAILYDVKDPDLDPDEVAEEPQPGGDADFERPNGIPGLLRYLTVHAESAANPALRINVNTAPTPVMRALFDPADRDLADAIIEHRREGVGEEDDGASASAGSGDTGDETGFFSSKGQLTRVDGMAENLDQYPRLDFFADTRSDVYSLRVVATLVTGSFDPGQTSDVDEENPDTPRDIMAAYEYREVVQRTDQGLITLLVERRDDPILER